MYIGFFDSTRLVSAYFLQTLALLYFPNEKFSDTNQSENRIYARITSDNSNINAYVEITTSGLSAKSLYSETFSGTFDKKLIKHILGKAFLDCAGKLFGYLPPWGMLTGIRPAKIAMDLMDSGFGEEEIFSEFTSHYCVSEEKASYCIDIAKRERKLLECMGKNDISVYISIPFCPSRCRYCSFVSYTTDRLMSLIPEYITMLKNDINDIFDCVQTLGLNVRNIYFGGGTPSVLDAFQIADLLSFISQKTDVSALCDYSFEAGRPDTVSLDKLAALKDNGIKRISINTQTTSDKILSSIGRNHTRKEFFNAFELARKVGFFTVNTDLIAGLPGESKASFCKSIDDTIALKPENITVHSFTYKRASEFVRNNDFQRAEDIAGMIEYANSALYANLYKPYYLYRQKNTAGNLENAGFSLHGHEALYNICIMEEYHTILAAGAGGVTKLVSSDKKTINRMSGPKYPYEYLDKGKYQGFDKNAVIDFFSRYHTR